MATDGPTPAPCSPEIFKKGKGVCVLDGSSNDVERWVQSIAKEANAQKIRLASHTTTLANEYARQGRDWEAELKQRAKEIALMRELGLPIQSDGSAVTETQTKDGNAKVNPAA